MSTEYPQRSVKVTVEVITEYAAGYDIDERDYLDWLGSDRADNDDSMRDYLRAGDELDVIGVIYDIAEKERTTEVVASEILTVEVAR